MSIRSRPNTAVDPGVSLRTDNDCTYGLAVTLVVLLPGLDRALAQALVDHAQQT